MAGLSLVLTDAQLITDLAATYKKGSGASLPPYWNNLVSQSHARAVSQIVSVLAGRGFSFAQIQSSDQGGDLERTLTLYWVLKRGGAVEGYSDSAMKSLDIIEELKYVVLTQGGALIAPAGPRGIPSTGLISAPDDIFQYPPTDGSAPFPPGQFANDDGSGIKW